MTTTVAEIISDATTADDVLAAAAPILGTLVPAAGVASTLSTEVLDVIQAILSWVSGKSASTVVSEAEVEGVEEAVDASEAQKFGSP